MSKLRFVLNNYVDTSSLFTSLATTDPVLNIENLKFSSKAKVMRTVDNSTIEIKGIFNSSKAVSAIILGAHNFTLNTRYTINLYGETSFSNLLYSSETQLITEGSQASEILPWGVFLWGIDAWGFDVIKEDEFQPVKNLVHWIDSVVYNVKSFVIRLSIDDPVEELDIPNSLITYFEIGRLIIGEYIEVPYNISFGHSLSWEENTQQYRTQSGSLKSNFSTPYRKWQFSLNTIPESSRISIQHGLRSVGLRKDFFMSCFPGDLSRDKEIDYSGIVKLTKIPKYSEFAPNYYRANYEIEEI